MINGDSLTGKINSKNRLSGKIDTGIITIYPELENLEVTPRTETQTYNHQGSYGYDNVTVNSIPSEYVIPTGNINILENGEHNVKNYETANVNISSYPPNWSQLGYSNVPQSLLDAFAYSKNIYDNWDATQTNLTDKFFNDVNLVYMPLVDVSNVTDMVQTFYGCTALRFVPLLNTSKVTSAVEMFSGCSALSSVSLLDTSMVNTMFHMFYGCTALLSVPLFNTSRVTSMNSMFYVCSNLTSIPLFDTSSVTDMRYFCQGCKSLITVPALNTSNITNGRLSGAFASCPNLSDDSLNNILKMCINAVKYVTSNKTLKHLAISSEQAARCQSLSNYQDFLDAGWTTGY